jgi:putative transposase
MPTYRRANQPGGTYFFTLVTYRRERFLCFPENVQHLREAFRYVIQNHPFTIDAIVILPDHLHCIWTLPPDDADFSSRWRMIKSHFSHQYRGGSEDIPTTRLKKQEKAVWQRRFWEHQIRDDDDFRKHVEYIHYNPVKHGLVRNPIDWEYSSFGRFVRDGIYQQDWGSSSGLAFPDGMGQE